MSANRKAAIGVVLCLLVYFGILLFRKYEAGRNKDFQSFFGMPYPQTKAEWKVASPAILHKIDELNKTIEEKRAARNKLRVEMAESRELRHVSDPEYRALEEKWKGAVGEVREVLKTKNDVCWLVSGDAEFPEGGTVTADHVPCG